MKNTGTGSNLEQFGTGEQFGTCEQIGFCEQIWTNEQLGTCEELRGNRTNFSPAMIY